MEKKQSTLSGALGGGGGMTVDNQHGTEATKHPRSYRATTTRRHRRDVVPNGVCHLHSPWIILLPYGNKHKRTVFLVRGALWQLQWSPFVIRACKCICLTSKYIEQSNHRTFAVTWTGQQSRSFSKQEKRSEAIETGQWSLNRHHN